MPDESFDAIIVDEGNKGPFLAMYLIKYGEIKTRLTFTFLRVLTDTPHGSARLTVGTIRCILRIPTTISPSWRLAMKKELQDTFSDADILFVIETVDNRLLDRKDTVKGDPAIIEAMLDHQSEKLYQRIMVESSESIMSSISPRLLFEVLLREARKELGKQGYTMERSSGQKIPVFDAEQVVRFLTDGTITAYLAEMMASFTRIESYPVSRQFIKGVWKEIRFNDMDIDAIIQMCESVEEQYKFGFYKRAADLCVFIPGMFPDQVLSDADLLDINGELSHYFGTSGRTTRDYEEEGALFYKLAAEHREATELDLAEVLWQIRKNVGLAKKPLSHISDNLLPAKRKEAELLSVISPD